MPGHDINSVHERAALARHRADDRLAGAMADFCLSDDARLDDRTRLTLEQRLGATIGGIESDLRRQAARLLAARGAVASAEALLHTSEGAVARLTRVGLLGDEALMDELLGRVRQDLIAAALPSAALGSETTSLLVRLADLTDPVAAAARALLVAESRGAAALPAELHHRVVWWVAAAIRPAEPDADADRAIAEAATRNLGAHDEGDRAEAVASRLAAAIDARPDELAPLLIGALGDRRLSLFTAVLAHAVGLDFEQARALVIEPEGDRLWLALRAVCLDRATIARIALSLADADPRRDIEAFADQLDRIIAIDPAEARAVLAPETLQRDFRTAIAALARSRCR